MTWVVVPQLKGQVPSQVFEDTVHGEALGDA